MMPSPFGRITSLCGSGRLWNIAVRQGGRQVAPWERGLVLRSVGAPIVRGCGVVFRHITTILDSITYDFCPAAALDACARGCLDANTSLRDFAEPYVAELFLDARTPLA